MIEAYRKQALAAGYAGDSILNSLLDTVAMMTGFALARLLPWQATVALVLVLEIARRRSGPRQPDPQYPEFHPSLPGHRGLADAGPAMAIAPGAGHAYLSPSMAVLPTEPLQIVEPFRGRNDMRRNLVGLSRDELKADAGRGRAGAVPRPPGLAVDLLARRHRLRAA